MNCARDSLCRQRLSSWQIFLVVLLLRLAMAFLIRTTFVPDEYYQAVDPALMKANSCIKFITWEWSKSYEIRSHISILLYQEYFRILGRLGISLQVLTSIGPRMLQSLIAAISDWCFWDFASDVCPPKVARYSIFAHIMSWSLMYCMPRTIANSTETALVVVIVWAWCKAYGVTAKFPIGNAQLPLAGYEAAAISLSTVAVYARPTSLIMLAPMALLAFGLNRNKYNFLLLRCLPIGGMVFAVCLALDHSEYHRNIASMSDAADSLWSTLGHAILAAPPIRFVMINFWENKSSEFGVHSFHWNFSQGLPIVLGLYLPVVLYGLAHFVHMLSVRARPFNTFVALVGTPCRVMIILSLFYCTVLSLSPHKEFRFLLPALPGLHLLVGHVCVHLDSSHTSRVWSMTNGRSVLCICGGLHLLGALYLCLFHQAGTESSFSYLSDKIENDGHLIPALAKQVHLQESMESEKERPIVLRVHLLAPCHSFPGYTFLPSMFSAYTATTESGAISSRRRGLDIRLYAPDCSIDVTGTTESRQFEKDPLSFWRSKIGYVDGINLTTTSVLRYDEPCYLDQVTWPRPDVVLTYDCYATSTLVAYIEGMGLKHVQSFRHAYFRYDNDDPSMKNEVLLFY